MGNAEYMGQQQPPQQLSRLLQTTIFLETTTCQTTITTRTWSLSPRPVRIQTGSHFLKRRRQKQGMVALVLMRREKLTCSMCWNCWICSQTHSYLYPDITTIFVARHNYICLCGLKYIII